MTKNKKIILLYPYYNGISGAYNRYLLLEKLLRKSNFEFKFIILDNKKLNFFITKIIYKFIKYLQVESLIIFYSIFRNYYFKQILILLLLHFFQKMFLYKFTM